MEKVNALSTSEGLLYQLYMGADKYNHKYITETQIRGWYIGYKEATKIFPADILTPMVQDMGQLLCRSIIQGQIYPTDVEWCVGAASESPVSYLMDFNEVTSIDWSYPYRSIISKIASDMANEPYWPLNDSKYPFGELFWDSFQEEAETLQGELEDGTLLELAKNTASIEDFDIELFAMSISGKFDELMRQKLKNKQEMNEN